MYFLYNLLFHQVSLEESITHTHTIYMTSQFSHVTHPSFCQRLEVGDSPTHAITKQANLYPSQVFAALLNIEIYL